MQSITLCSHVGEDGILQLQLPVGVSKIDLKVTVTVQTVSTELEPETPQGKGWPPGFFLTLVALENSDITANSQESFGGRVSISSQGIFGTEFRDRLTPESDITATSALGPQFSGTVVIQTPGINPSQDLAVLPTQVVDVTRLVAQSCTSGNRSSQFTVTGRSGLPPNPTEPLSGDTVLANFTTLPASVSRAQATVQPPAHSEAPLLKGGLGGSPSPSSEAPLLKGGLGGSPSPSSEAPQLVEAQGWVLNEKGQVVLTADPTTVRPHNPWQIPISCQNSTTPKTVHGNDRPAAQNSGTDRS